MTRRRLLVTGASGFLGQHLARATSTAESWEVVLPPGRLETAATWTESLANANIDSIVHLAALVRHSRADANEVYRTNVDGTAAMVRLAAQLKCRLVYLSTSGTVGCFATSTAYADEDSPYCEERVARWPYYASKIAAERTAIKLAHELDVELVTLRPPVMLGPGDHRGRSTSSVQRVLEGKIPVLFDGGMNFVDVRDVAAAIFAAVALEHPRAIYHLPGHASTLADYFRRVARLADVPLHARRVPASALRTAARLNALLGRFGTPVLPDPVIAEMATSYWGLRSKYAEELNFKPRDADVTLVDTIASLRSGR